MSDEYKQVAALLALDIDVLARAVNANHDAEFLLGMINNLQEKKDKIINDPTVREMRYNATCNVFSITKGE